MSLTQQQHKTSLINDTSISFDGLPQQELILEQANSIVLTAHFLYSLSITYSLLPDGTYEVSPVGDNDFTTIVSASHLCQAIVEQITCFMESPVFIEVQTRRLQGLI